MGSPRLAQTKDDSPPRAGTTFLEHVVDQYLDKIGILLAREKGAVAAGKAASHQPQEPGEARAGFAQSGEQQDLFRGRPGSSLSVKDVFQKLRVVQLTCMKTSPDRVIQRFLVTS